MGRHALTVPAGVPAATYDRHVLPDWLLWLLPVPVATGAAIAWATWSSRTRGPQDPADSVEEYARFRAALGSSVRPPGGGAGPSDRPTSPAP